MNNKTKFLKFGIAVLLGAGAAGILYAQLSIPTDIDNAVMTIKQINITPDGQASTPKIVIDGSATDNNYLKVEGSILMGSITGAAAQINKVSGDKSSVLGGVKNTINGSYSIIPGGSYNQVTGNDSFAFGNKVRVNGYQSYGIGKSLILNGNGSFVFSDGFPTDFTVSKDGVFIIKTTNGVGVNTGITATGYKLTVDGSGIVYGNLKTDNMIAGAYYYQAITNNDDMYELKLSQWEGTGDIYYDSGYVGIGTSNPTAQLHVDGNVRLANLASSTQSTALVVDTNGNVTTRALNTIAFGGYTETDPLVNTLGKATLSCAANQIPKYNGTSWYCSADAGLTTESDPSVNTLGKTTLSCIANQIPKFNGVLWYCATDAGLTGESDPTVNTLGKATLSCAANQIAKYNGTSWYCAADAGLTTESDPTAVKLTTDQTVAGVKTFNNNTIFNGSVGIGITNPLQRLHVNGSSLFDIGESDNSFVVYDGPNGEAAFRIANDSTRNIILTEGNQYNVGIGTANPATKLDVNGNITTAGARYPGSYNVAAGSVGVETLYGYIGICVGESNGNCQGSNGVVIGNTNTNAKTNIPTAGNTFFNNGGNLGVGTTSPSTKLDVRGLGYFYNPGSFSRIDVNADANQWSYFRLSNAAAVQWDIATKTDDLSNALQFRPNGSTPTVVMQKDGKVGIGTTSPGAKLDVNGRIRLTDSSTELYNSSSRLLVRAESTDNVAQFASYGLYLPGTGNVYNLYAGAGIQLGYSVSNPVVSYANGDLIFSSNATERMRLTAGGNLGIGTTTPLYKLDVAGEVKTSDKFRVGTTDNYVFTNAGYLGLYSAGNEITVGGSTTMYINYRPAGTATPTNWIWNAGSSATYANHTMGTVTASAFYYSSDKTLKKDLKEIKNPLDKIIALNGYYFTWKSDNTKDIGVVAQEVEKVFPEAVKTDDKGLKSVKYGNLIAPVIEAIKELYNKYLDQQNKISTLEKRIEILEKSINK